MRTQDLVCKEPTVEDIEPSLCVYDDARTSALSPLGLRSKLGGAQASLPIRVQEKLGMQGLGWLAALDRAAPSLHHRLELAA